MLGSMHVAMVCAGAMFVMATTGPALAEVSRVVVKESGPLGTFGGRQYTWVTAAMEGTVARDDGTTGHYRVPCLHHVSRPRSERLWLRRCRQLGGFQ